MYGDKLMAGLIGNTVVNNTVGDLGDIVLTSPENGASLIYNTSTGKWEDSVVVTTSNDFTTALKNKLNAIEASATADQTGAQIKAAYETESNAFTNTLFAKLNAVEALADKTDATNVLAAGAVLQSSVQALGSASNVLTISGTTVTLTRGDGSTDTITVPSGGTMSGAAIKTAYQAETNAFTDAQFNKLAAIEASATADQTSAQIKSAYEGNAQTNALTDAGLAVINATSNTNTGDEVTASATAQGVIELATQAEVNAGTSGVLAVTATTFAAASLDGGTY